jgi:hypothetical protein
MVQIVLHTAGVMVLAPGTVVNWGALGPNESGVTRAHPVIVMHELEVPDTAQYWPAVVPTAGAVHNPQVLPPAQLLTVMISQVPGRVPHCLDNAVH